MRKNCGSIGSSDGYNYQQHADWFFSQMKKTPWIEEIFQHEIQHTGLIQCFEGIKSRNNYPFTILCLI